MSEIENGFISLFLDCSVLVKLCAEFSQTWDAREIFSDTTGKPKPPIP